MGGGDVSQLEYDTILELCHKYSRGTSKKPKDQEIYWQELARLLEVELQEQRWEHVRGLQD
jgi:hypothetical protein